jgi:hypothetical protein
MMAKKEKRGRLGVESDGIFWRSPAEFCWRKSFASATFASKPHQQNLRCASKISNAPAKSLTLMILTCQVKKMH